MSGTLPCRNDTQCRPRFGDIWRCRRHVADMSPTCGAKMGIRPPQPMVEADAARRHGRTAKTKIISARGPRRVVRRNSIVQEDVTRKNSP